jgi:hypothetical protein
MTDVSPEDDIGPFYKTLGAISLIGAVVLILFETHTRQGVSTLGVIRFAILLLVCLALIRPRKFDEVVKTIADKLPIFSFRKTDGTE